MFQISYNRPRSFKGSRKYGRTNNCVICVTVLYFPIGGLILNLICLQIISDFICKGCYTLILSLILIQVFS